MIMILIHFKVIFPKSSFKGLNVGNIRGIFLQKFNRILPDDNKDFKGI